MRDPNATHESLKSGSRSPYLLWLVWIVWLPFLIPPIVALFQAHPPLPRLIAILVGVALFVGIYLWATWRNVQRRVAASSPPGHAEASPWLVIAALTTLSITLALLVHGTGNGNEMLEPFIFTSAYIGGSLPTVRAAQAVAALTLLTAASSRLLDLSWFQLGQGVVYVAVVGVVTISMVRSVMTARELHAAREEIARLAVMTERLRIARDLHDLLGHNLSLIALKSELARRLVGVSPERAAVEIGDVEHVARTTLQEVREAVASYRQPTLSSELHGAQEILSAAGIDYRYEGDESITGALSPAIEAVLSWTVREGVTNVIQHSHAHQCTIRVTRERHTACVEVLDDGAGVALVSASLPPGAPSTDGTVSGGNGLRGLAERVAALGGRFEAGPRTGGGFRLAVSVPLVRRNHDTGTPGAAAAPGLQRMPAAPPERFDRYGERSEQL